MNENDIRIVAEKKAGEELHTVIEAPTVADALAAISCLIERISNVSGIPVTGMLGRLAVVMLGEKQDNEEQ